MAKKEHGFAEKGEDSVKNPNGADFFERQTSPFDRQTSFDRQVSFDSQTSFDRQTSFERQSSQNSFGRQVSGRRMGALSKHVVAEFLSPETVVGSNQRASILRSHLYPAPCAANGAPAAKQPSARRWADTRRRLMRDEKEQKMRDNEYDEKDDEERPPAEEEPSEKVEENAEAFVMAALAEAAPEEAEEEDEVIDFEEVKEEEANPVIAFEVEMEEAMIVPTGTSSAADNGELTPKGTSSDSSGDFSDADTLIIGPNSRQNSSALVPQQKATGKEDFSMMNALVREIVSKQRAEGKFRCPECGEAFDSEREVDSHMSFLHWCYEVDCSKQSQDDD